MVFRSLLGKERASGTDLTFGAIRLAVSSVLVWGALTKLLVAERMEALARAWEAAGVPEAQLMVAASISLQLLLSLMLLVGMFTRAAGLLNGANFAAAAAVTGIFSAGVQWWPIALLVVLLLHFGIAGAGRLSIDGVRARRTQARSIEEIMLSLGVNPSAHDGNYPGHSGARRKPDRTRD